MSKYLTFVLLVHSWNKCIVWWLRCSTRFLSASCSPALWIRHFVYPLSKLSVFFLQTDKNISLGFYCSQPLEWCITFLLLKTFVFCLVGFLHTTFIVNHENTNFWYRLGCISVQLLRELVRLFRDPILTTWNHNSLLTNVNTNLYNDTQSMGKILIFHM